MKKKIFLVILSLIVGCYLYWTTTPSYCIYMIYYNRKNPPMVEIYSNRLISYGESAIPSIINTIRKESPFVRGYGMLPEILLKIGDKAYQSLHQEIKIEKIVRSRSYLIFTLQSAFDDWSYFENWLFDLKTNQLNYFHLTHMYHLLKQRFDRTSELPIWDEQNSNFPSQLDKWWAQYKKKIKNFKTQKK